MSTRSPRTLATIADAGPYLTDIGGQPGPYELAIDPARTTLHTAVTAARRAEAARIDAVFTADRLTFDPHVTIGAQEPLIFFAALSQVTSRVGLIATVSSTFNHPFTLARQFGTLDHVSNGRAAWNLVTSAIGEENYGPNDLPSPDERYARAAESLDVINALWDSWQEGALRPGPGGRAVLDAHRVRAINHVGRYYTVAGPLNIPPLPQGRPVQFQSGQSEAGIAVAAKYAEVVFTSLPSLPIAQAYTTKLRGLARQLGRPAGLPLIFSLLRATFGATEQEARQRRRDQQEAIDLEHGRAQVTDMLGGGIDLSKLPLDESLSADLLPDLAAVNRRRGRVEIFANYVRCGYTLRDLIVAAQDTGHWALAGTPEQLADAIEERFRAGVLDVISLNGLSDDRQHDFVVNGLLPELRRRRIVKPDYLGPTLRENLALPWPTDRRYS